MAVFISKGWQYLPPPVPDGLPGRYFLYTPEMNLLAETAIAGAGVHSIAYEYLWFNGEPVAQSDGPTLGAQHWTFTDHLGTSLRQYDSTGTQYWRAEYEPYGRIFSLQTVNQHQPLRLPGQEVDELAPPSSDGNAPTKRLYNIFRWYRPNWGRYTQPDPLGLSAGLNLYGYGAENPLRLVDPLGLVAWECMYNLTTANMTGFGLGAGAFNAHCTSECACGRTVTTDVSGMLGGVSALTPLPGGTASSDIVLTDPYPCPAAGSLSGLGAFASGGAAVGLGFSYTKLELGSASGTSDFSPGGLLTIGLDVGVDVYGGPVFTTYSSSSPCCPSRKKK